METNPTPLQAEQPKNNRNMIIWIVVAVVLCCCCVVTAVAGYYGYQAYLKAQEVTQQIQDFQIPTDLPLNTTNEDGTPIAPNIDLSGQTPEGGLADEETRFAAWTAVQIIGMISGCSAPTVDGTTITVLQQPDASGNWQEEWNVNCGDGTNKAYKVDFTTENGIVTPNVEMP